MLDDGERAPPGGSAEARAAMMGVRDDGERSVMLMHAGSSASGARPRRLDVKSRFQNR